MAIVFPQQLIPSGAHRSPSFPATMLPNGDVSVTVLMGLSDMQDINLLMTIGAEGNDNPQAASDDPNWYVISSIDWQGNSVGSSTHVPGVWNPPQITWSQSVISAKIMRGLLMNSRSASLGLDITVTPPAANSN